MTVGPLRLDFKSALGPSQNRHIRHQLPSPPLNRIVNQQLHLTAYQIILGAGIPLTSIRPRRQRRAQLSPVPHRVFTQGHSFTYSLYCTYFLPFPGDHVGLPLKRSEAPASSTIGIGTSNAYEHSATENF